MFIKLINIYEKMKDNGLIKISRDRINKLYNEAIKCDDINLSRRYITLMENIAKRMDITIERRIKLSYCKKCKTPYKNFNIRIKSRIINIKCNYCGDIRRIPLNKVNPESQAQSKP